MNKSDVQVGACVRVITDRWDAPAGTVARVESVGRAGVLPGCALPLNGSTDQTSMEGIDTRVSISSKRTFKISRSIPAPSSSRLVGFPSVTDLA